jgi:hypothetical protein
VVAALSAPPNDAWSMAQARAQAVLTQSGIVDYTKVTFGPVDGSRYTTVKTSTGKDLNQVTFSATYTFVPLIGFAPMPKLPMSYSMTMLLELEN